MLLKCKKKNSIEILFTSWINYATNLDGVYSSYNSIIKTSITTRLKQIILKFAKMVHFLFSTFTLSYIVFQIRVTKPVQNQH